MARTAPVASSITTAALVDGVALPGRVQRACQRPLGRRLQPRIERGVDDEVVLGLAQMTGQPVQHPVDEVGADLVGIGAELGGLEPRRLGLRPR